MRVTLLWLGLSAVFTAGCSLLFNLDADQCQTHSDCDSLGGAFTGRSCIAGVCESCKTDRNCTDARGDGYVCKKSSGSSAGVCRMGTSPMPSASMSASMMSEAGPEPDAMMSVDTGPSVECTTNKDCEQLYAPKWICKNNSCLNLVTADCPVVLQAENLTETDPIIIGAYSAINPASKETGPITRNYDLALQDFTDKQGLPGGANGARRGFVAVVCEGRSLDDVNFDASLTHLIDTLGVPGIVASILDPAELRKAFNDHGLPKHVLFIDPLYADTTLTTQDNDGLLWFILGEWRSLAHAYVKLTNRAEDFQRMRSGDDEVRVALVQGSTTAQKDIASVLTAGDTDTLTMNGELAISSSQMNNFKRIILPEDFANDSAAIADTIQTLNDFAPHIIVLTSGSDFVTKVMLPLEDNWVDETNGGQVRPFYVLSPEMAAEPELLKAPYADIVQRSAGINFEGNPDRTLYDAYRVNYQAHYPEAFPEEWENFYDAMYYLAYSVAAAGNPAKLDGDDLALGMERLTARGGMSYNVGPSKIPSVLTALAQPGNEINLNGVMGPSNFFPGTGTRDIQGSVWCINGGASTFNVLRIDKATGELTGTFPCFSDF